MEPIQGTISPNTVGRGGSFPRGVHRRKDLHCRQRHRNNHQISRIREENAVRSGAVGGSTRTERGKKAEYPTTSFVS